MNERVFISAIFTAYAIGVVAGALIAKLFL
jgi:hypothetical protein